jgi:cytochrome c553
MASRKARHYVRRRLAASAFSFAVAAAFVAVAPERAIAQSLQDKIAQCAACHGEDGQSKDPGIPHIGGQPKLFVMYQLFFYREGRRKNPEMNTIAKELSDAELDAIATFVSKLPPSPAAPGTPDSARYQRGAKLAQERICASCHNADYSGREQMPRLAGQHPEYTLKALQDYRAGVRIGTQAAMPETVRGLSDEALADLAHYLAHFKP